MIIEYLQTPHGIFTNNYDTGKVAQEVYQEYLNKLGTTPIHEPTVEERLSAAEDTINFLLGL